MELSSAIPDNNGTQAVSYRTVMPANNGVLQLFVRLRISQ